MRGDQLRLLLWKNYVIRKRQPGMLSLVLLWPVLVFLVLYIVRDNTDPTENPTCQFPARLMPQNDFLPFLQSYICSLGNPCNPLSEYEEVPSYKSAKLGPLLHALSPVIKNETIMDVAKALPKSIQFLRSMARVLTQPGVKKIFERGVHLGDLFKDHDEIKDFLKREVPELSPAVVNNLLNVSIKMQYFTKPTDKPVQFDLSGHLDLAIHLHWILFTFVFHYVIMPNSYPALVEAFGSSNMDGIICSPEGLRQFLILPTDEDLLTVSKALCALNSTLIPDLLQYVTEHLDFNGLFNMINLVTAKFSNYDIFEDLQHTADSILKLKMVDLYVPKNLKLQKWLPMIIPLFKNVTFRDIDLSFIDKAVELLDPIFYEDRNWPIARKGFLRLNSVLGLARDFMHNKSDDKLPPNSVYEMSNNLVHNLIKSFHSREAEKVSEMMDYIGEVLEGGARLTKILLHDYEGDIEIGAEILDSLRTFFSTKIMNTLSYLVSFSNVIVQAVHHVATLHFESSRRVWNVTQNHTSLIRPLLALNPSVYRTVVESFSRLDLVEKFVEVNKHAGDVFCTETMLRDIFNNFTDLQTDSKTIRALLCSEEGKQFLTEIYDSFDMNNFERLVRNMLATFVYGVLKQPMPMTSSNLTTVVRSIKQFAAYLETPRPSMEPDWEIFAANSDWSDTFRDTSAQGRLDILGIHLSIAKRVGRTSLSYSTIEPSLRRMDFIASHAVKNLQSEPVDWAKEVNADMPKLIDAFYLTAANRSKVLDILEISNFTQALCKVPDAPQLISYPAGSNVTRLKHGICRISEYIEEELNHKFEVDSGPPNIAVGSNSFNWTAFNQKLIVIYGHIDKTIHKKYPDYDPIERQRLKDQFSISWTKNLTARDAWEVSIGLLCKLGTVIESPVYGELRDSESWKIVRSWATAFSNIFRTLHDRVRIVMDTNGTSLVGLNLMPQTEILEDVILRNIQDGLDDGADLITLKLPDFSAITEYRKRETDWPCLKEQSIGEVLGFRNGTRKIVREIERIACNPGSFVSEWQNLFRESVNSKPVSGETFEWTEGYKKFRQLIGELTNLSWESSVLSDGQKVSLNDIQGAFENTRKFIDSKFTDKSIWNDILTSVDNKLNDLMNRSNYSVRTIDDLNYRTNALTRLSVFAKDASHVIHEIATVALNILNKGPEIEALSVLGFGDKSPVKIVYSHLPGFLATFIRGLGSSSIMSKISLAEKSPYGGPTCDDVFAWFAEFRQGISEEDYRTLKNSTCDADPMNFNEYTDLILKEDALRRQESKNYPLYATRTIFRLYELGTAIQNATKNGLRVNPPFTRRYWDTVFKNLTHELKQHRIIEQVASVESVAPFHIAVELIAEILRHLTASLQKIGANEAQKDIHLWDLVEDGDLRQLIKLLELHPRESISLAASLARVDPITTEPITFNELKKKMCEQHFGSGFWNETQKIHFLQMVCSFDPVQLLKSATSQEFYDLTRGLRTKSKKETSLSEYLADVIDASFNLSRSHPGIVFKTNIFDVTTWKNLDNTTWSLIYDTEQSWLHYHHLDIITTEENSFRDSSDYRYYRRIIATQNVAAADSVIQILSLSLDLLSGGDVWEKTRAIYERKPQSEAALSLIEDLPNLMISILHTFFNTESINSSVSALINGKVDPCEVDKYLITPNYFRKTGFLESFSDSCKQMPKADVINAIPIEVFQRIESPMHGGPTINETQIMLHVKRLQSVIIQSVSEGFRDFKVPTFLASFIVGNFKDFVVGYESMEPNDILLSTIDRVSQLVNSIVGSLLSDDYCPQCEEATNFLRKLNEHLSKHDDYVTLFCNFGKLNFTQLQEILFQKLNLAIKMNSLYKKQDLGDTKFIGFSKELERTEQYVKELANRFLNTSNGHMFSCMDGQFNSSSPVKPTTYIGVFRIVLALMHEYVTIFDTASTHRKIGELSKLAEKSVPIWMPLRSTIRKSDINEIDRLFHNASINVNMLDRNTPLNETDIYTILVAKRSKKFMQYSDIDSNFPSMINVSRQLAKSLDFELIQRNLPLWRYRATTNLYWLKKVLEDLETIAFEAGNMLDAASTIDFNKEISDASNLLDKVVRLLREETIDKFFDGLNKLLDDGEPFISDPVVKDDLRTALSYLESMEIFKNLGLLNTKYAIKEMFPNWPVMRSYLMKDLGLFDNVTKALSEGKVDMLSVYTNERKAISLKDTICSPDKLGEILEFKNGENVITEISTSLCQLSGDRAQNITVKLIKKLNFGSLFKDIMSASVKNILSNANLNETDGKEIIDNLGYAAKLVPLLKDAVTNVSDQISADFLIADRLESTSPAQKMDFQQFLSDTGQMLCGQPVVQDSGRFFKVIASIEDNKEEFDDTELASLPTDFCRDTYKEISKIGAGKILWTYVKPLLRGQILYTPRTSVIDKVMREANSTFVSMEKFGMLIDSFEKSMTSLANLTDLGESLTDLKHILASDLMKIAMKSFGGASLGTDMEKFDLGKLAWKMKNSTTLINTVRMLNKLMDCVLTNRVIGFSTEAELEEEASRLVKTNEFLAGVVFIEDRSGRSKRSYDQILPDNITYKIRMDVDSVPPTSRLKNQFWTPGPDSSFVENLRYLRGFVQLQDSIDRALIKVKTQTSQEWQTVSQQMPYPCWKFLSFQSTLYESQALQVCFFFALMMCVGAAVRHIVWERESQNSMVMSVMGLKPWRNTFAWFITSMIELTVVAICIHIILIAGKILPHSDPILVLLLLLDYVFATVTFCYMISTLFSSASLAAVTTVVMFLLTYMPYIIVIAMEASLNLAAKLFICLNMSTSFCFGCLYAIRKEVQGTGLTWGTMWEESSPGDYMSLGLVLLTIAFDGCLYALIGYLVTRYTNSGKGFHGLRSISLWWADSRALFGRPSYLAFENQVYFTNDVSVPSSSTHQDAESDVASLPLNDEKQIGVRFDDVRKVYQTDSGECVAVDGFTMKLMEGEVTTLLGRNGAGKTTIIKMLTGMIAPTSGEICLPSSNNDKPNIGVCPQTNVLIGCLTAREHMTFYATLKNKRRGYNMSKDINTMLTSMELNGQEDELVSRLSGGTQRRLCVCLAFLGAPNLVILDEPGAGVDPAARRRIWRLIDKHRIGKTVLLSTHHLDEADMLSDTVVIMHKGKILSSGSPLTLKLNHGQGYKVTVSFPEQEVTDKVEKDDQDTPKALSAALETMKDIIEDVVPTASIGDVVGTEVKIILPFQREHGIATDVAGAVKALEDNQQKLGFSHFNVECDTLERVFLDMCAHADGGEMYAKPASSESLNSVNTVGFAVPTDDVDLIAHEPTMQTSAFRQGKALLKKRFWHFSRDWRAPLAALVLPTLFVAVAMGFSLIRPPSDDLPALVLTPELYGTDTVYFYSIDSKSDQFHNRVSLQLRDKYGTGFTEARQSSPNDTGTCECVNSEQVCHGLPPPIKGLIQTEPGRPTIDWITSTQKQYIEKRYGGWSLSQMAPKDESDGVFVVWYNNKGYHSLPAYVNALNEAILRANGVSGHLTTINHPIKLSRDQLNRTSLLQHVADVGIALVLLVAFSLVGAQGAKELVRERLSEEKRILYLAGVRPLTYWTTALIWDLLVFAVSIMLAVIVFEIFGLPAYVARDNLPSVCLLLFLYAWAVIPFTHLAEKIFDDSSLSNMVLFCVNTFIGVLSLATILIIDILGNSQAATDFRNFLHQLLLIFPQYALGDGLIQLSKNDITADLLERFHMNTYKLPLSWGLLGPHCLYLFLIGAVLYVINLIIECRAMPDLLKRKVFYPMNEEDEDVAKERNRVEKGLGNDVLKTLNLRKEYKSAYGKNVAVQDLSFGIQPGECFGLFGVNGAGKSTTFKMLTTEITPTAGQVVLSDKEVGSGPLCSGDVGYCPQSDALDPFLTPYQSLTIHGEVSGIRNVPRAVEFSLKRFDLTKYAHQRVASLSGGNKRKLCAAISVMVPSRIVLMDEATSGMDPASKDLVIRAVKSIIKDQGSVLMTSHSVAECENVCTRVGVLARAGLKCIGSPQYLKHKYGEGYIVFLRFKSPTSLSELLEATARHLPGVSIASRQALATRLLVPRTRNNKLSTVFGKVKDLADELNAAEYTLTQSSLDQVLVNFSEELDDDKNFENGRMRPSHDSIYMNTMRPERFTALPIS